MEAMEAYQAYQAYQAHTDQGKGPQEARHHRSQGSQGSQGPQGPQKEEAGVRLLWIVGACKVQMSVRNWAVRVTGGCGISLIMVPTTGPQVSRQMIVFFLLRAY